jgi:hypothetical protein
MPLAPPTFASPPLTVALAMALAASALGCGGPPAPVAPAGAQAAAAAPAARDLASAEAVLEAAIAASGGRDRLAKLRSLRQTGTFELVGLSVKGTFVAIGAAPRSMRTTVELAGMGTIEQGVVGDVAWELSQMMGARILAGAEAAHMLREATFNADLVWADLYPKAVLAGVVDHGGAPAYKLVLTAADGAEQTRYYGKAPVRLLATEAIVTTQMGKVPTTTRLSDWREVGGLTYPFRIEQTQVGQRILIAIDRVELDVALEPAAFALPAKIEALRAKP